MVEADTVEAMVGATVEVEEEAVGLVDRHATLAEATGICLGIAPRVRNGTWTPLQDILLFGTQCRIARFRLGLPVNSQTFPAAEQ